MLQLDSAWITALLVAAWSVHVKLHRSELVPLLFPKSKLVLDTTAEMAKLTVLVELTMYTAAPAIVTAQRANRVVGHMYPTSTAKSAVSAVDRDTWKRRGGNQHRQPTAVNGVGEGTDCSRQKPTPQSRH